ncbi:stage 0 sporulation protein [bacterium CG_4_10_14_0_2_um_filter_33_32]|nr:MAG: hypothetical protein AUJ93_02200 [bacterium CG2_30_33_46]PIR67393.1 MAG: stage 0 sporulation protein [bacterium CG10_big_fil_rev_8_21_14_0_10_33_18]PIU76781.1 MAG: stage 0 sporulation protein [bacterium CG06_land_8_20_14_3_00_33_50]PIW81274.1 MAG: stage 0 sporulation protein [bacterium CG_4_8_14_3_um_filter_33_28]PIY85737.1 MAG: stage 0 sporulation protein [bacterium CG_4_10_14_0_8_um_filter_33_57]PIZ86560.1 MAG: stage 0 sporulation protein [bacterium CG_4_10_14_0_2_um_filter_33_32]PJ
MKAVGIRFKNNPKIYDFLESEEKVEIGDLVIVETLFGEDVGAVVYIDKKIEKNNKPTQKMIRKTRPEDFENQKQFEQEKEKYEKIFKECANKYELEMKLVGTELSLEDKIIFLFTAENRVDFRDLVKELIKKTKRQVRLRQIGPRDESQYLGGFGQCGRQICCQKFLGTIESVTMDMARDQNMASKGSSKISGLCGRLMCCLSFEENTYKEILKSLPKIGDKIKTKEGVGRIIGINALKKKVEIELSEGARMEVDL